MNEHNTHGLTLLVVGRCADQCKVQPNDQCYQTGSDDPWLDHTLDFEETGWVGKFLHGDDLMVN